jgi:CDP-paratose 2-epimerase
MSTKVAVITGAAGLVGSECVKRFAGGGLKVVGIDNNLRQWFFGPEASTLPTRQKLTAAISNYEHYDFDIRDRRTVNDLFVKLSGR